jgi:starch synthase
MRQLRILHVAAELAPHAKAGGLADAVAGLSAAQAEAGHDVRVLIPDYAGRLPHHLSDTEIAAPLELPIGGGEIVLGIRESRPGQSLARLYLTGSDSLFGSGEIYHGDPEDGARFLAFCRSVPLLCDALEWSPDIVHCHDWHTGLLPLMLRTDSAHERLFTGTAMALTIHNIGYQGVYAAQLLGASGLERLYAELGDAYAEHVNLLRAGIEHADAVTTVSPTHAKEITTDAYGMGLEAALRSRPDGITGILNGVDYETWDPESDPLIPATYSHAELDGKRRCRSALERELGIDVEPQAPLVGCVTRLVWQKGVDLIAAALPRILDDLPVGAVILGEGEHEYVEALRALEHRFPTRFRFVRAHDEPLAHRVMAASDFILVPSRYEPCGLAQMYAMRYGAIPVVRRTGGLADTVTHFDPQSGLGTGSVFEDPDPGGLDWGLRTAIGWYREPELWEKLVQNAMFSDFSWHHQSLEYAAFYRRLLERVR